MPRPILQHEIRRRERLQPAELDLEVGAGVAGDVAVDDGLVVRRACRIAGARDQPARVADGEVSGAVPGERLVAGKRGVGVDRREVDPVLAVREVGDDVAQPLPCGRVQRSFVDASTG